MGVRDLSACDRLLECFAAAMDNPRLVDGGTRLCAGVDLGTAVMEKVASIVKRHLAGYPVEAVYLAGGTSCLETIEEVVRGELGIPVLKPAHPLLVTPLGIAMHCSRVVEQ